MDCSGTRCPNHAFATGKLASKSRSGYHYWPDLGRQSVLPVIHASSAEYSSIRTERRLGLLRRIDHLVLFTIFWSAHLAGNRGTYLVGDGLPKRARVGTLSAPPKPLSARLLDLDKANDG